MKILVVNEDIDFNLSICASLKNMSIKPSVHYAESAQQALDMIKETNYDVILTEIVFSKSNGVQFLIQLKQLNNCGVIVLSKTNFKKLIINAYRIGADDFIIIPCDIDILMAKINNLYKRIEHFRPISTYNFNNLKIEYNSTTVHIDNKLTIFKGKNFDVLAYLTKNANRVVPKEELFQNIWGEECDTPLSVCEVYVSNVRKILNDFNLKKYLKTVKNVGYIWDESNKYENKYCKELNNVKL